MKKIALIGLITFLSILVLGITSFAANNIASDAVNGVRNIISGAENVVENTATSVTNGIRNGISSMENVADNMTDGSMITTRENTTNYDAARTATTRALTTGTTGFLGMSETVWTWIILGIVGAITIALVWYYGKEHDARYNHNDNNY